MVRLIFVLTLFFMTSCPVFPQQPSAASSTRDFDLVSADSDPNGYPHNPSWSWQAKDGNKGKIPDPSTLCPDALPNSANCASQKTWENLPHFPKVLVCMWELDASLIGHINWTPATFEGGLLWQERTPDQDCNFGTWPAENRGLTHGNVSIESGYLGLEFDSRETIQAMHTKPWAELWSKVSSGTSPKDINTWLVSSSPDRIPLYTVLTGLFGLDCEHDCHSELHPIFGMAVQLDPSPNENVWGIMIRNWGNEGFCAHGEVNLNLPGNEFKVFLPHQGKAPTVLPSTQLYSSDASVGSPKIIFVSNPQQPGLLVSFTLPPPSAKALVEMELHLKWSDGSVGPSAPQKPPTVATQGVKGPRTVEEYLEHLQPPSGQTTPKISAIAAVKTTTKLNIPDPYPVNEIPALAQATQPLDKVTFSVVPDPTQEKRDTEFFSALCKQYKNSPPRIPAGVCAKWMAQHKL